MDVASEIQYGNTTGMGFLYAALIIIAFYLVVALAFVDSRPVDADRPTRWLFPLDRRD
jgi:hypothetical protein